MKKLIALILVLCCIVPVALADTYGLGVVTTVSSAQNATAEKNGQYEILSNVCSVVLDDEGKIVDVWFDVAQTKVAFNAAGEVKTEAGTKVPSKFEKKEAYGMGARAKAGEWYLQARAFELYCIGKTVGEVLSTPLTASGAPDVADLKTTCTIGVYEMLEALAAAAANAR